jgi:hypothetical protein
VAGPRAAAHAENDFMGLAAADDLIQQGNNGIASTVEDARAANVNHVNVR